MLRKIICMMNEFQSRYRSMCCYMIERENERRSLTKFFKHRSQNRVEIFFISSIRSNIDLSVELKDLLSKRNTTAKLILTVCV
jgi:hypothetical protein